MQQEQDDALNKGQTVVADEQDTSSPEQNTSFPNLEHPLDFSEFVIDVPASKRTKSDIDQWRAMEHEKTRSRLTLMLMTTFMGILAISCVLTSVAAFNKNADKSIIQNQIPLLISTTSTLLAGAMGYYFGNSKK
jgi:hypothetical protein